MIRRLFLDPASLERLQHASKRGRWPMPPLDGAWLTYRIVEIRYRA